MTDPKPTVEELVAFSRGEAAWFRRNRGDVGHEDQGIMTTKAETHDAVADALERLQRERDEEQAAFLACAKASGIVYEGHGIETAPGPLESVVDAIEKHAESADRVDSLEAEIQEAIAERDAFAQAWDGLRAWIVNDAPPLVPTKLLRYKLNDLDPRKEKK